MAKSRTPKVPEHELVEEYKTVIFIADEETPSPDTLLNTLAKEGWKVRQVVPSGYHPTLHKMNSNITTFYLACQYCIAEEGRKNGSKPE